jgi:hypothetical protein
MLYISGIKGSIKVITDPEYSNTENKNQKKEDSINLGK